ncbi:unnamed protein product, partial [Amoebophrya sp. A25]
GGGNRLRGGRANPGNSIQEQQKVANVFAQSQVDVTVPEDAIWQPRNAEVKLLKGYGHLFSGPDVEKALLNCSGAGKKEKGWIYNILMGRA